MTYFFTALVAFWVGVYLGVRGAQWYCRSQR
jgi:hypothetical protein